MSESLDGVGIAAAIRSQGAQEQYYRAINRRLLLMGYQLGLDGDFDDDPFSPGTQKGPPAQVGLAVVPVEAVYAVFESKQEVERRMVQYAQQKVASVRRLKRTSITVPTISGPFV